MSTFSLKEETSTIARWSNNNAGRWLQRELERYDGNDENEQGG